MAAAQPPRWQAFRDAAAGSMHRRLRAQDPAARPQLRNRAVRTQIAGLQNRPPESGGNRRRTDLRLVPAALLVWGTAAAGTRLDPAGLAGLCGALAATAAGLMLGPCFRPRTPAPRSFRATLVLALLLSAVAGAHSAVASAQRNDGAVAEAVSSHAAVVAEIEVAGEPRRLADPGRPVPSERWAVPATLRVLVFDGRRVDARAQLLVLGGGGWGSAAPGQRLRTTGTLRAAGAGEAEAGLLSASAAPVWLESAPGRDRSPAGLRKAFTAAAAGLPGDARGLLPGMVTGDTGALDPQLGEAMKAVGMTHLTAVSGANCSLVLGVLLLAARSLRLPRAAATGVAFTGLGWFVLMVGPDASVLRAALMGTIGLAALALGRGGHGLSLLCLASIGLLLADPALAGDYGFVLSVLATLGIVVAGRPLMRWLPDVVPRWAAAGFAVPLAAQLFCGPVIILLQAQFSSYALPANLAAAALVPPVTLLGTAAVPLVPVFPALAALPIAIAGAFAAAVAAVARWFASLPGAALPWPEGPMGAATMAMLSGLCLTVLWLAGHPVTAVRSIAKIHGWTAALLAGILDRNPSSAGGEPSGIRAGRCSLADRAGRGRLRVCISTSRRNHKWLLPRPNAPGPLRRRLPPGGM